MTAVAHITIARRRLSTRLPAILQTAVAALVAWYLCVLLLPDPQPLFACIATVVSIGATHGAHRQRATQLVAGVVCGLAVADAIIHVIGTGAPQLAVMVVLAMSVAVLLNGSELVISEAAVSAMLLVMTSSGGAFSPNRILEAMIGGVVALAVALLFSPDPILPVSRAAQAVFGRLGRALERTASALDEGDAGRAEQALEQARSIDSLLREFDDALATSRETVRTAPTRFGDREPIDRYDRSLEQVDLAVRNTRVLARHSLRAIRAGENPGELRDAVNSLAGSVWALAAAYDEPERAEEARVLASSAAVDATALAATGGLALAEVAAPVRSAAVDLMRAAELVAGMPEELPTEELLLLPAPVEETPWVCTFSEPEESSGKL
ncbi:FUSC family protein [Solirubrobacter soli]|uniref:FUSC family protein n=1 Tax=Solirubrobacter soli TaxID=363832 RepID=UPI00040C7B8E|nr:FUSC family protein [Solirubrobacter soli]